MIHTEQGKHEFFRLNIRVWGLITACGVVASAATIFGFFGSLNWFLDLFSHFRVQYCLGLAVIALLLIIPRQRKLAAIFGALAVVNLCMILPLYTGKPKNAGVGGDRVRAMLVNVNTETGKPEMVADLIKRYNPDIVALEEISDKWVADLHLVFGAYPHVQVEARDDNFGIALLSRLPFTHCETIYIGGAEVPSVLANVRTTNGEFTVLATHAPPPAGRTYSQWRNQQLNEIPNLVHQATSPVLVIGDLNVSPWSPHFRQLLRGSGLRDSSQGRGIQPTWPTFNPLMLIPLDHCLYSSGIEILAKEVVPGVGSDHFPIVVDFVI